MECVYSLGKECQGFLSEVSDGDSPMSRPGCLRQIHYKFSTAQTFDTYLARARPPLVSGINACRQLTGRSVGAIVGLVVDSFVDVVSCGAAMGDPQSFQATHADTGASKQDVVDTRAPLNGPAPVDVKKWMNNFFLNQAYGAFCLNVLADIFFRLFLLICTYLTLRCCWRAKERETRLTEQQLQRHFDDYLERQKRYLRSDSYVRRVAQASTSAAQSSSTPAPSVRDSQVQAYSLNKQSSILNLQGSNEGISPASPNSTKPLPTECEKVVTGADQRELHEKLPKKRNGFNYDCHVPDGSPSLERVGKSSSESSSSRCQPVPTQARKVEIGDDVVIDIIPVICVFPSSASIETGNKFKQIVKDKVGVSCDLDISSSRIMQARVPATGENLSSLRDLAVEGMKCDKGFTLQIGRSFLYYCNGNPKNPVLLSLGDVEVPTVLQADYSAGVLTIRGMYLEGAEIRAATFDGYMILKCIRQDQINNNISPPERRIEVWRCTDLLLPVNLDQIQICASKRELIEGHSVTVRSELSSIQNLTLRTVIRNWVPTAILIVFLTSQAWILLELFLNLVVDPLHRTWLSYLALPMIILIIQLLTPSVEDNIKDFVERFKLALSSFHVTVVSDPLTSPAFYMRGGYCFQRGAKQLVKCDLVPGALQEITPRLDENLPSSRDWKWPCFREEYSSSRRRHVLRIFDPDSVEESHSVSHPFVVSYYEKYFSGNKNYDLPLQYIPQNICVKLYSKKLQDLIWDLLPAKLKRFEKYGEIQACDLLVLYIKALGENVTPDMETSDPSISNDKSDESRLDLFHLFRFLRKEYEETIKQYKRMMEADVISWDMLWTLIVPKADVIYHCDISGEELCGKVVSTRYKLSDEERMMRVYEKCEFIIELEAYDYNCVNFEAKRINCTVTSFKDEIKISDLDVYPIQHKADPQIAEDYFYRRGRRYCDVVLKSERRFMKYQGLLYVPFNRSKSSSSSPIWSFIYKESVDGRVMIDQGGFAKMEPNVISNIPSKALVQGNASKMKAVIEESDPLLKYAPAIGYGYSFSVRKWGCFNIEGLSEIQFISTAFDTLVMNEDIKNTLLILTEHHIKHPQSSKDVATSIDPFPNKGKGCIVLLHGPPGTGKTLTVESLAEKMECPLWQLSVPKNFGGPQELETALVRTFEIAASWRAILVLDEADVYLSSRKYSLLSSDVSQTNAMTGVFLRVLEYYTGILFLTTNVVDSIESAIYSRMSLFVKYEEFSIESRKLLWMNFLNRIGFQHPSQAFWDKVLPQNFNGRVIRNIIQNAQIIAESKGASLSEEHLLNACHVMAIPFILGYSIESDDKRDPKQASTTISTYAPSVVTNSTLPDFREEEKWRNED